MPYLIATIVLVIAAAGFTLYRMSDTTNDAPPIDPVIRTEESTNTPADFTPPTEPPPSDDAPDDEADPSTPETDSQTETESATPESASEASGTYLGEASYSTGRAIHELDVTLTLENNIVTAADITYDDLGEPQTPALRNFNEAYEVEVIGKNIDEIELSRVGGASWTSDAFNEAVAEIRAQI